MRDDLLPPADEPFDHATLPNKVPAEKLGASLVHGLSDVEAKKRLEQFGYNEVEETKTSPFVRLGQKFWGFTAWMLEITMVFSLIFRNYLDFYIIGALLIVNALIGFAQEQKASSSVEALRSKLHVSARVLRDGSWQSIPARLLVPGDVVRVRAGDFVPADLKIAERTEVSVDQSVLTGESLAVERHENEMLYSGGILARGETTAVVVTTGARTYFGKTTELLQSARPKLHMEEMVSRIVGWLLAMVGALIVLLLAFSLTKGVDLFDAVSLSLVLIVFAVPVALPAMFTVSMAAGSQELARRGVLVTRLSASEDAASMDVLCADKTGTITANRLSVASLIPQPEFSENDLLLYGALASQEANQDPIDLAIISAAKERQLLNQSYVQLEFLPFDPATRRTEAVVSLGKEKIRVMKGAVKEVALACGIDPRTWAVVDELAAKGYRVLAVALSRGGGALAFCGLVALYDRPRPDSKGLIGELKDLGVSVKMLTGDALPVAREIAKEVGLGDSIVRAQEIKTDSDRALRVSEETSGFAEVYPEDKFSIVKTLQAGMHVVGMTGDGINDAPALRQAEVGIAVSNATDVAKGAASAVLTNEGLSNIVDLVKTGRMVYQRIVTWTVNKIVKTFEVSVFVALAFLVTGVYVVSALDIILLLFLVDFVTISIATDSVSWSRKPDRWNVSALAKMGILLGVATAAELFGLLYLGATYLGLFSNPRLLHTFVFSSLLYMGLFTVLIIRERRRFWNSKPSRSLGLALVLDMIVAALLVTIGIPGVAPISPLWLLGLFLYIMLFSLVINDEIKIRLIRWSNVAA